MRKSSSDFGQFARAGLDAFEQADILDRNRRLVSEGRDQLDLLLGEWPTSERAKLRTPIGDAFAQQRNAEEVR